MPDEKMSQDANRKKREAAYAKAAKRFRQQYRDEFQAILEDEYGSAGIKYVRPKTAEERAEERHAERRAKAAEQLAKIHADFPELSLSGDQE